MLVSLLYFVLYFHNSNSQELLKKRLDFQIVFIQNDSIFYPDAENTIYLEKKPFTIKVFLNYIPGVYVNISAKDSIYNIPMIGDLPGINEIPAKCMAEDKFNIDNDIIISQANYSYWYYDSNDSLYRFNSVDKNEDGTVTGIMHIYTIYNADTKVKTEISDIKTSLYFTFLSTSGDYRQNDMRERQRSIYCVKWRD